MKKEIKKILPITSKPSIITCIHHSYPLAIIESKEVAILTVCDFEQKQWETMTENSNIETLGDTITISETNFGEKTNAILWRKCDNNDEFCVKIDYVKLMDKSRYIDLFLFDTNPSEEIGLEDKSYGIRWNPYGLFIRKQMYNFDTKRYTYIKMIKNGNSILYYTSYDGDEWTYIDSITVDESFKFTEIGIHIYSGIDQIRTWKNMNFVQLIYNETSLYKGIWLDYYMFPRKNVDNAYFWYPNFLETVYETTYEAIDNFGSLHDYIKFNIRHSFYVELCLDEFYLENRDTYLDYHFPHYNLFFGYDDTERVYYILGYGPSYTPVIDRISYDLVCDEYILSEKIIKMRYSGSEISPLKFNVQSLKISLYELVNNINSSNKFANILTPENVTYGISVLKRIATTEVGIDHLLNDRRISVCIKEHCIIMGERIEYLFDNKYICLSQFNSLKELHTKLLQQATILLNLVLKNEIKPLYGDQITKTLLELYDSELLICTTLLQYLNSNNSTTME